MIERRVGFDAVDQELIDDAVVEVEPLGIRRTGSVRKYARPRNRKAISFDAELLYQANVLLVSVIVIVGAVRIAVVADVAGRVRERIPDRAPSPVFIDGAFDLIRGGGGTPHKAVRKSAGGVSLGCRIDLRLP